MVSGDNHLNNSANLQNYKTSLLSLISGKQISQGNSVSSLIPASFKLHQNYPNPFNPVTKIKYDIPTNAFITIKIYDLLGREIFSVNEFKTTGQYEVKFDGSKYASGMYFYSMETNGFKDTKKMVLIK